MTSENRQRKYAHCACVIIIAIILFFFASVMIRLFTRQILVKRMGINNSFTNAILFDVEELNNAGSDDESDAILKKSTKEQIDWEALYPFPTNTDNQNTNIESFIEITPENTTNTTTETGIIEKYKKSVKSIKKKIDAYVTDYLIGYETIVEMAKQYESIIQLAYAAYGEYNGIIKLPDGQLTSYIARKDISGIANSAISFSKYCRNNDIDFIYAQAPYKISKTQDINVSGVVDFSNQNADDLIERLRQANIDVYDFRSQIDAEGLKHHDLFYRTDNHWRGETGLWAAQHILEYLNENYSYDVDPSVLDKELFTSVMYPSWFLGSRGKKATLAVTTPDDFQLIYPTYETNMHLSIPDINVDLDGDFSIMYNMAQVEEIDYYNKSPYGAYMYGTRPLAQFENHLASNDVRLLFIHDSFGNCVLPFVSLGVKYIDSLDIRFFTGSVQKFIEDSKPDAVIVLYNPSSITSNWPLHKATFDFR